MIATIFRVVTAKLWESTQVNPEYVDLVYQDSQGRTWSGSTYENEALLAGESSVKLGDATREVKDVATQVRQKSAPAPTDTAVATPASPIPAQKASTSPVIAHNGIDKIEEKRTQIEAAIRGFFDAGSIDLKLVFSRDPLRVRPLMEGYYKSHPLHNPRWKSLSYLIPVDEPGYRFGYAQAVFEDADPITVVIEETQDGRYCVDWEHSVNYGELDWKEFLKIKPAEPTLLRVVASKPAVDPAQETPQGNEVLEIRQPGQDGAVLAYFDRNDPKFLPLIEQLKLGNWTGVPLTLRLCFPGPTSAGGTPTGARIAKIEGKGWLILQETRS
ncbi:MAG: hypothetical protein IPK32_12760 [Verrucomicrobiaceae bacterium]|nr:hypothetical protein [Verrucomicrobiaceae bacterium]